jgi:hypothetical protein
LRARSTPVAARTEDRDMKASPCARARKQSTTAATAAEFADMVAIPNLHDNLGAQGAGSTETQDGFSVRTPIREQMIRWLRGRVWQAAKRNRVWKRLCRSLASARLCCLVFAALEACKRQGAPARGWSLCVAKHATLQGWTMAMAQRLRHVSAFSWTICRLFRAMRHAIQHLRHWISSWWLVEALFCCFVAGARHCWHCIGHCRALIHQHELASSVRTVCGRARTVRTAAQRASRSLRQQNPAARPYEWPALLQLRVMLLIVAP